MANVDARLAYGPEPPEPPKSPPPPAPLMHRRITLGTLCLVTVGLFDLVTTIVLLGRGMEEGNPLFARLLEYGPAAFVGGKVVLLAGPILLLEFVRTKHPKSAEQGTWLAFLAYVALYGAHLMQIR